ncbi:MAG: ROK family protein [Paraglaciecola sp.]|uniref:ROK family protein n=1 Tax=Paraglaciecola sp. TaxID=1920173 RepID=UPI003297D0FB
MHYGLDVGGTKIELAIFNADFTLSDSWRVATPGDNYQQLLATLAEMVDKADQTTGCEGSVGIGFPGIVDSLGCAVSANIPSINGQPLVADTLKILNRPVGFENDVKAFVLSEANGGAAQSQKNVLGLVLGTGVAGGLCIDGQLLRSKQNVACEFGHIPLPAILQQRYQFPLRQCGCGLLSCVEEYLAGPGLLWMCTHFEAGYTSVPALIKGLQAGESKAQKTFDAYIDCLGCYLAQLTLMYDPDIIVLGGGLSNINELYPPLAAVMKQYLFKGVTPPNVVAPKFGDSSGVRGAAFLGKCAGE